MKVLKLLVKTCHVEILYFFLTGNIKQNNTMATVIYCLTKDMIDDVLQKHCNKIHSVTFCELILNISYYPYNKRTAVYYRCHKYVM